jgi:hypothetical protein
MLRFLLPAAGVIAAMLVLVAGTFDDLPSWRWTSPAAIHSPPHGDEAGVPAPSSRTDVASAPDEVRRQVQDLQSQVAKETREVAALRAIADQTRQELASLRDQRPHEQSALAPRQVDPPTPAAAHTQAVVGNGAQAANAIGPARSSVGAPEATSQQQPPPRPLVARRLAEARTALAAGRVARARWLLRLARSQVGVQPATTGQSDATAGNSIASRITEAIDLADRGDSDGALRVIDQMPPASDATRQNYRVTRAAKGG